jgi:hypothetical protein
MDAKFMAVLSMLGLLCACISPPVQLPPSTLAGFRPQATDTVQPEGLPRFCKWMLAPDLTVAHWLGARVEGKELVEPINVVLMDRVSASPQEAANGLAEAFAKAGFPSRKGHSGGYFAYVDDALRSQLPAEPNHAFSDQPFELPNNHGRVFGPVPVPGGFLFVAAFSRESIAPLAKLKHTYASFSRARDHAAKGLDDRTSFKRKGWLDLRNRLENDPVHSTGDHDGRAVLLERR